VIPKIDSDIGILIYTTSYGGCGGKIRQKHEDFVVSEILSKKTLDSLSESDGFAVYRLAKAGIDTNHALERIFRQSGVRLKALGLKDSSAMTEQYVCSMGKNKVLDYSDEKILLQKVGFAKKPLTAKDMIGNDFAIKITGTNDNIAKFTEHERILNFYGYQRFGSKRPVTHLVGKALIQKRYDDAVNLVLSYTSEYDSNENKKLRQMMSDSTHYLEALKLLPMQMDLERILIKELVKNTAPQKAICKLPLAVRRIFVDAYQSFLFNLTLSESYQYGEELFAPQQGDVCYDKNAKLGKYQMTTGEQLTVPLVGHSYFKKTRFDYQISKILAREGISPKDFFLKEMQELSNEGGFRTAKLVCTNFSATNDTVRFTLQRGSFATMVLREMIKPTDPIEAGF
jgi:tRNA pseudouridine13 synthase